MGEKVESWIKKIEQEPKYTKEEIVEYLQRRAKLLRHTPTIKDLNLDREGPSKNRILEQFESYEAAIAAAGLKPLPKPWSQWGDDELIELIKRWYKDHPNAHLTHALLRENPELPSATVIKERFGGIKGWMETAGLPYVEPKSNFGTRGFSIRRT